MCQKLMNYRFEPDMLAFSGCYYGGGEKERYELGEIRKRWATLPVRLLSPITYFLLLFALEIYWELLTKKFWWNSQLLSIILFSIGLFYWKCDWHLRFFFLLLWNYSSIREPSCSQINYQATYKNTLNRIQTDCRINSATDIDSISVYNGLIHCNTIEQCKLNNLHGIREANTLSTFLSILSILKIPFSSSLFSA